MMNDYMSKQRIIKDEMWNDDWFYELDPSEKLMWVFLLTNPRSNIAGIYKVSMKWIAVHTGFEKQVVEMLLNRFKTEKKITIKNGWIFLNNFHKHQSHNPKVEAGVFRIFSEVPLEIRKLLPMDSLCIAYPTLLNLTSLNSTLPNLSDKTPAQLNRSFFEKGEEWKNVYDVFIEKGIPKEILDREFMKFWVYWTEPNKSGTKVLWETKPTFDVKRRLFTWLNRTSDYQKTKTNQIAEIS